MVFVLNVLVPEVKIVVSIDMYTNNYTIPVFIIPDCDEINKVSTISWFTILGCVTSPA